METDIQHKHNTVRVIYPVDGRYGWVMVMLSFLIALFAVDNYGNLGIFMVECKERFGISTTELTWIGAFRTSLFGLLGVTVGEALHIYGNKVVLITGSLLIFTGQCGCALFPQLGFWWLLFMYGIVPGIGFCCYGVVVASTFQEYFVERRGIANAIVNTGYSVGLFIWSPLVEFLFSQYGWTGGLLINAGLHLHIIALSQLVIPAREYYHCNNSQHGFQKHADCEKEYLSTDAVCHKNSQDLKYQPLTQMSVHPPFETQITLSSSNLQEKVHVNSLLLSNSSQCLNVSLLSLAVSQNFSQSNNSLNSYAEQNNISSQREIKDCSVNRKFHPSKETDPYESMAMQNNKYVTDNNLKQPSTLSKFKIIVVQAVQRSVDFSLLKEIPFLMFCLGMSLVHLGHTAPMALVTVRAVEEGVSKRTAAFLISLYGICSGLSSPVWGFLADVPHLFHVKPLLSGVAAVLTGFASLMFVQVTHQASFLVYTSLWGIISGSFNLQSIMVAHLLGVERVAKGAGTMYSVFGVAWLLTYILSGFLIDAFGNTVQPFFVLGAVELLGGVIMCAVPVVQKYHRVK